MSVGYEDLIHDLLFLPIFTIV